MSRGFKIIVQGDYALFTRPEMKLERVSYDVPPPGALEGLLKSVYWKPAISYEIDKIIVFNPINFTLPPNPTTIEFPILQFNTSLVSQIWERKCNIAVCFRFYSIYQCI